MNILDPVTNFGRVPVSTGYKTTATTVVLSAGEGERLPQPSTDGEFNLTWWDAKNYPISSDDPNREIVRVTARSSDTLTVIRGQEGITATTKNTAGGEYYMMLTPTKDTIEKIDETFLGWNKYTNVIPTRASADDPTYVLTFAGVDLTEKVSEGMKIKYTQDVSALAYFKFEGNSTDEQGSHDGTDTDITYSVGNGKFNQGAGFNGSSSKIELNNSNDFKPSGAFSMGGWFKTSTTGAVMTMFLTEDSSNSNTMGMLFDAVDGFGYYSQGTGWITGSGLNAAHCDGNWHQGTIVYDGTTYYIYVDGELIHSENNVAPTFSATTYTQFGMRYNNVANQEYTGAIDDFFFIDGQALPQTKIKEIYESTTEIGSFPMEVQRYGFVTAISFSTDTTLTLYGGTDYDVDDTATYAISDVYFSHHKAPLNFPLNPDKWSVEVVNETNNTVNSPGQNTVYNTGNVLISVPIGVWKISGKCLSQVEDVTTGYVNFYYGLSTSTSSFTNEALRSDTHTKTSTNDTDSFLITHIVEDIINLSTKTTYYSNMSTGYSGVTMIAMRGDIQDTILRAVSCYL